MLRGKPGTAPPIGDGFLSRDLRERVSAEERRFLAGLSLLANFEDHTSRRFIAGVLPKPHPRPAEAAKPVCNFLRVGNAVFCTSD